MSEGTPRRDPGLGWGLVSEHAGQPTHTHTHADANRGCCGDSPAAQEREVRARRLGAATAIAALAVAVLGVVIGGWVGATLVLLVAGGIATTLLSSWSRLSLNERLMRVAVVLLLVALALVRAIPR